MRFKNGKCELEVKDLPDIEEAKRLWMSGKSSQHILEEHRRKKKSSTKQ